MNDPMETSEILAFARTVDARSLSRAAIELGVPRATVGRRLARLEERLGVRLIRRTTRSLALTDAGEALYRHARIVLDAVKNAEASVRRTDDAIRGELRVAIPPFTDGSFNRMIADFAARHPDVRLHVRASTAHVDLRRDGYDVALRAGADFEPGLISRTIARSRTVAVASPGYLAQHGAPSRTRELSKHRCLMGFARGEVPQAHWPTRAGRKLAVAGSFFSNDLTLLRDAALAGLGIALIPAILIEPELRSGELVAVLEDSVGGDERIAVVYVEREFVPPQLRAFIDTLVAWAPGQRVPSLPVRTPRGHG